jgi:3-deoxy-D-manno-octulosonic-acid transferase
MVSSHINIQDAHRFRNSARRQAFINKTIVAEVFNFGCAAATTCDAEDAIFGHTREGRLDAYASLLHHAAIMFAVYEALLLVAFIVALPWFLVVGFLRGKYLPNFRQRLGYYRGDPSNHDLWIHAVSVGEVIATRPVVDRIIERRPQTTIVVTTTTITGQDIARRSFPSATLAYFPFDFSFSVKRFLRQFAPRAFASMETEIWPNVSRIAHARGLKLVLANGRLSDRSYPRYRSMRWFFERVLRLYSRILVREQTDVERFIGIGAPREIVQLSGNIKFDIDFDQGPLEIRPLLDTMIAGRKVFVAGSTMEGEDEALIPHIADLVRELDCFIIIAPRKPERFEIVAALLTTSSARFLRRSELSADSKVEPRQCDVLLLDSIGELARIYALATASFVGGSLVPIGGHNPIEPAAAGSPVAFGPYMSNFREIAATFLAAHAAAEVRNIDRLLQFVKQMILDPAARAAYASRALATIDRNRGASDRIAAVIVEMLD